LKDIIEGRMEEKRTQGRRRVGMLDDLMEVPHIRSDKEKSGGLSQLEKWETRGVFHEAT